METLEQQGYTCMNGTQQSSNGSVLLSTSPSSLTATYSNEAPQDYLTPASPVPDLPTQPRSAILPSFTRTQSQPAEGSWRLRDQPFPRTDSGIESDVPRSPTSPTSTSKSNMRASTLYEYIDPKDVDVEERPHNSSQVNTSRVESSSSGISSTAPTYLGDVVSDPEEQPSPQDPARRRVNPMYEALEQSATRLYSQTCQCKVQSSANKQLRYLWCAFILTVIITLFLLSVIAYVLFLLIPGIQDRLNQQETKLEMVESTYGRLQNDTTAMQQALQNASTPSSGQLSVANRLAHLNMTVWTLRADLQEFNMDLQQQIANISLTPGPQGPPGIGNSSRCVYFTSTSYQALPGPYSTTPYFPDRQTLQENIVMSATCAVVGGTQQFAETTRLTSNAVQYRCRCDGEVDTYDRRACVIHLVMCPRPSSIDLLAIETP